MSLLLVHDWLLFSAAVLAGGAALAPRHWLDTPEAWCVGMSAAVAVLGFGVFLPYALGLGTIWYGSGYVALFGAIACRRARLLELWRDRDVRQAAVSWSLVTLGCLLLLACVMSYSGGLWMGDWEEHYQRPLLFLRLRPEDEEFRRLFTLTARPPLANVADAALLWVSGATFPRHQVFMLLLNSLAFFPTALFCRTFGGGRAAAAWVAFCVILNPVFLQNATYAWTKLITVFFVLVGLHVLFTAEFSRRRVIWGFALLGLAVVTHYSACVWLLAFGAAWFFAERRRWKQREFWHALGGAALAFSATLAPWLVYAMQRYGAAATFASNSTVVTGAKYSWQENLLNIGSKLWTTLVPHPLRTFDRTVLAQGNPWAEFRDHVFYIYQSNLLFAFGTPVLLVLTWVALRREWPRLPGARVWPFALPLVVVLGTAVHGTPDNWGLAHICLQPLTLLGVALAAARLPELFHCRIAPWLTGGLIVGWVLDFIFGIALHYSATAYQLNRTPGQHFLDYISNLSGSAQYNFWQKIALQQHYFADHFGRWPREMLLAFGALALWMWLRGWRASRPSTAAAGVSQPPRTAPQCR